MKRKGYIEIYPSIREDLYKEFISVKQSNKHSYAYVLEYYLKGNANLKKQDYYYAHLDQTKDTFSTRELHTILILIKNSIYDFKNVIDQSMNEEQLFLIKKLLKEYHLISKKILYSIRSQETIISPNIFARS